MLNDKYNFLFLTNQWSDRLLRIDLVLIILSFPSSDPVLFPSPPLHLGLFTIFCLFLSLFSFPATPPRHAFPLQLGLWSRRCLRPSWRGTPSSCTATWLVTRLQRSSGGTPTSTELTPSSSYGTEPAGAGCPSTQPTAPMGSVCWASRGSRWRTLEPTSVGPAMTPSAMTSD